MLDHKVNNQFLAEEIKKALLSDEVKLPCLKKKKETLQFRIHKNQLKSVSMTRISSLLGEKELTTSFAMSKDCYDMMVNMFTDMIRNSKISFDRTVLEILYLLDDDGENFRTLTF